MNSLIKHPTNVAVWMSTAFTTSYTIYCSSVPLFLTLPIHSKNKQINQCHLLIYSKLSVIQNIWRQITDRNITSFAETQAQRHEGIWGPGGIHPHILNLGTRMTWLAHFTTRPLYPSPLHATTDQEAGWEPEAIWTFRSTQHRPAVSENRTTCPQSPSTYPSNYIEVRL